MEIWETIRRDAERGAEQMVAEYGDRLFAAAALMCPNDRDAEDLVFRTLAQAVKKIRQFRPTGDFYKWLYTIMLNFRRMDVRKKAPAVVPLGTTADLPEVPVAGFVDAVAASDAETVREAVRALAEPLREAVVLRYFEGRSVEETAELLGVPAGTVKSRLFNARRAIHAALTENGRESR